MPNKKYVVLVCGGREFWNPELVDRTLREVEPDMVITGGAPGADYLAQLWAEGAGVHCAIVKAQWEKYGKSAGVRRNLAMLWLKPDLVVAFPGGRGTAHMLKSAQDAGVPVMEVSSDG